MDVQDFDNELEKMFGNKEKSPVKVSTAFDLIKKQSTEEQNSDNEEFIVESPFRASDPTCIDRKRIMGFEKKGQLLKRIKRELSSKNLDMESQQSRRTHKRVNTQSSVDPQNYLRLNWNENEKDQMRQQVVDDYEKQIVALKGEVNEAKQERKQVKQTLQKERRFFMSEMYSKQLKIEQISIQISKLQDQIQKHVNVQYQMQERIRELQLQNSQYKYKLERLQVDEENMSEQIGEENQQEIAQQIISDQNRPKDERRSSHSLERSRFVENQEDKEIIKLAHQDEIEKYEKQIKNLKQFYQAKLIALQQQLYDQIFIQQHKNPRKQISHKKKIQQSQKKLSTLYKYLKIYTPFLKGFGVGGILMGICATLIFRNLGKK